MAFIFPWKISDIHLAPEVGDAPNQLIPFVTREHNNVYDSQMLYCLYTLKIGEKSYSIAQPTDCKLEVTDRQDGPWENAGIFK